MNKGELITSVSEARGAPKTVVEGVFNEIVSRIGAALKAGERVDLQGFGSFQRKDTAARQGRNPRTGEPVQIAAGQKAAFKASKQLLGN